MKEEKKPYDLNLKQHQNHRRSIPWLSIIKFIIGVAMIGFIYYYIQEVIAQKKEQVTKEQQSIEGIEIQEN